MNVKYSNYRLYSFVANHYLSHFQCGLQTAHVVGNMSQSAPMWQFQEWAAHDKTIIICSAGNQAGVKEAHDKFTELSLALEIPVSVDIFAEDLDSMNGMVTACGVLVPECFWNAKNVDEIGKVNSYCFVRANAEDWDFFDADTKEFAFIEYLKSFRLVPV